MSAFATEARLPLQTSSQVPFPAAGLAWDTARKALYLSDQAGRRVVKLELADGQPQAEVTLEQGPEALFLSPDGRYLYVSLPVYPHSDYDLYPETGFVGVIDTATFGKVKQFEVSIDPYELVATDEGLVVVGSGSRQWTRLHSYDVASGLLRGESMIGQRSRLTLHPSQRHVYAADTDSGPSDIRRYDLDPATGALDSVMDSPYHGQHEMMGRVFAHPNGTNLVVRGGGVFSSSTNRELDMRFVKQLEGAVDAVWWDEPRQTLFTVGSPYYVMDTNAPTLHQHHLESFEPAACFVLGEGPRGVFANEAGLWVARVTAQATILERFPNPALGAETNQAPAARFVWAPNPPTTIAPMIFDASATSDDRDALAGLEFRWDWNEDGVFDTAWSTNAQGTHFYNLPGTKVAGVEVRDGFGAVGWARLSFDVQAEEDPGAPGPQHPAWDLPFAATAVVFDPVRPLLYATDAAGRRLVRVNLETGLAERQYAFAYPPDSLAITPDGRRLYVALLTMNHEIIWTGAQSGFLAEFDLERRVKLGDIPLPHDPGYLAVGAGGWLLVAGGTHVDAALESLDPATGAVVGAAKIWPLSHLATHPQGQRVYAVENSIYLTEYDLDPATGALTNTVQNYIAGLPYPGLGPAVFVLPSGEGVLTSDGSVFSLDGGDHRIVQPPARLAGGAFSDAAFDVPERSALFTVSARDQLQHYNTRSWELVSSSALEPETRFVGVKPAHVYAVTPAAGHTLIRRLPNPASGAETNQPTVARFVISPAQPNTRDPITFDASPSTDDRDPPGSLLFRWDLDNDGAYDTEPTNAPTLTLRLLTPGTRTVALWVRDSLGEVSVTRLTFEIEVAPDPGLPGEAHTAYRLPFAAVDAAFDPVGTNVFLSYSNAVVRVNLTTGRIARRWLLPMPVERLTMSPSGHRLYAVVLPKARNYAERLTEGYVAEFDVTADALLRTIRLGLDPWEIIVTPEGRLLANAGSGTQDTALEVYDLASGTLLSRLERVQFCSGLAFDPLHQAVFCTETAISTPSLRRFTLDPQTGALTDGPYANYDRTWQGYGRAFALPEANMVMTSNGRLHNQATLSFVKALGPAYVSSVAALPDRQAIVAATGNSLAYATANDLTLLATFPVPDGAAFVGGHGEFHYALGIEGAETLISRRRFPAADSGSNSPPVVAFTQPMEGAGFATGTPISVRLTAEDTDGAPVKATIYLDGTIVADLDTLSFATDLASPPAGPHQLTAQVIDNLGATSIVATVTFNVTRRPKVVFDPLLDPATVAPGESLTVKVTPSDPDGAVAQVRLEWGADWPNQVVGVVTNAPWQLSIAGLAGDGLLGAIATDNHGVESDPVYMRVHVLGAQGDDFYWPWLLTGMNPMARASNTAASPQKNEPAHAKWVATHSLWWDWVAPTSGVVVASTENSGFDTVLAVYAGTNIGALSAVAAVDDAPGQIPFARVKWRAQAGTRYHLAVDGALGDVGEVALSLAYTHIFPSPPANDAFADRFEIVGTNTVVLGDSTYATGEALEPSLPVARGNRSTWWWWAAPTNGVLRVTTRGSAGDTLLVVYDGAANLSSLRYIALNDDDPSGGLTSAVAVDVLAGHAYTVMVDAFQGLGGLVQLALAFTPTLPGSCPPNDDFERQIDITGTRLRAAGTTAGATRQTGEPWLTGNERASVWFRWLAPRSGPVYLGLTTSVSLGIGVYEGQSLATLIPASGWAPNRTGKAAFLATAGMAYAIAVQSAYASSGEFVLELNAEVDLPELVLHQPQLSPDGRLGLLLQGEGLNVILDVSPDLKNWTPIQTNRLDGPLMLDLGAPGLPSAFFRGRVQAVP